MLLFLNLYGILMWKGEISMNKKVLIVGIIIAVAIVAVIIGVVISKGNNKNEGPAVKLETEQDMKDLVDKIYENLVGKLPSLQTYKISTEDITSVQTYTGLKSADNIEILIASEPLMSSQAYSLAILKVAKNADIEAMKQEMLDNIDTRRWICVQAEKLYVTNYEDVIFLVMASDEWATPVYNEFKNLVGGKTGKELTKTNEI